MALVPLAFPPGIVRNGTQQQSRGRYYHGSLVRFFTGSIQPEGGWRQKSATAVTGKGRAIFSWRDNSGNTWTAIATEQKLYAMVTSGVLSDITPVGFTTGRADAVAEGGYGDGTYGTGYAYGGPIPDSSVTQDASTSSLDNFGQYLVFLMTEDGKPYTWTLNTGVPAAAITASSGTVPTGSSLFVTAEGMLMVLGANGNPRLVQWSGQQDYTVWQPLDTNQAGDYQLGTQGRLMQGLRVKSGSLLHTDVDVWAVSYLANQSVYGFEPVGHQCGVISRCASIAVDADVSAYGAQAVWWGDNGFFHYNGYTMPLPCDVWDYLSSNLNILQKSKITVEMDAHFGEVRWNYPSISSTEVDSYVAWNIREGHWHYGQLARLSGVDAGITSQFPMRVGADGYVYEHEVGSSYTGAPSAPFLESGPVLMGNGDFAQDVQYIEPDDKSIGDVEVTFFTKMRADDAEATTGPITINSSLVSVLLSGRYVRIRYDTVNPSWRVGVYKLDMQQGDAA